LLSNTLKFLEEYGINQAVINAHHLSEQIVDYVNNNKFNLAIDIVKEKEKILIYGGISRKSKNIKIKIIF